MIYHLGLLGVAAFSITGVLAAGKKGMDIFSIILLGVVTAIGGGTLRDIILDKPSIFWINDLTYLWVAVFASVVAFFGTRLVSYLFPLFLYLDAFGLALFAVLATENTLQLGYSPTVAVLMGVVTGITGGMIRDVLTGRMPLLLGNEFYATPALFGTVLFIIFDGLLGTTEISRLLGIGTIFLFRVFAIRWNIYYPSWLTYRGD